jgi:hypothetical protein
MGEGGNFDLRGHLVISEYTFDHHNSGDATGIWSTEARGASKHSYNIQDTLQN